MSICTVTRTWSDGVVDSYEVEWPKHTAVDACQARLARLRWARANFTRDSPTAITIHHQRCEPATEHLAWRDIKETP